MHILFIGCSNLIQKRILPVISQINDFNCISIAKYEKQKWPDLSAYPIHASYDDFDSASKLCKPDIVYVSTVNSAHFNLAKMWLEKKVHVIIDKPAVLDYQSALALREIALENSLLLAESTVYTYHPQMNILKKKFSAVCGTKLITIHFSFPPLDAENFRYKKDLGGGAVYDTAPYAVSLGRFFFNSLPQDVHVTVNEKSAEGIPLSYSLLLDYGSGCTVIGHLGFTTEYVNRINLLCRSFSIDVDRIFTTPDTLQNTLQIRSGNTQIEEKVPAANTFIIFFQTLASKIKEKNYAYFLNDFLMDAQSIQMLNDHIQMHYTIGMPANDY